MKKVYTTALMIAVAGATAFGQSTQDLPEKMLSSEKNNDPARVTSNSQVVSMAERGGGPLWSNNFDTPADWTIDNEAGNTDDWVIGTAGPAGPFMIDALTSTSGGNFALFDSDALCSGNQVGNLTTANPIDLSLSGGAILEFEQFYREFDNETYVLVSTDGTNWTSFQVNEELNNNDAVGSNPDLAQVNIASVTGGQPTVWIRFQFYSPSSFVGPGGAPGCGYAWMVDDVALYEAPANDLIAEELIMGDIINDYAYSKIPVSQAGEVIVGALVRNFGTADQNNVSLAWEVTLDGSSEATGTAAGQVLHPAGVLDTVWINTGYIPTSAGDLEVSVEVSADETEDVPANNEAAGGLEITNYVWAHDYEDEDYFLTGYGPSDDGVDGFEMGASYFALADGDMIYALQFALGSSTTSQSITAKVYEDDLTNGPISETVYDIMPGDLSSGGVNFITVVLDDPVAMTNGSVYTGTVEISAGDAADILINSIDDGDNGQALYLESEGNWFNWIGLSTTMRLNLDASINIEENEDVSGVYMYPNPTNDVLTVGFVAKDDQNMTINVIGTDGALVLSEQLITKVGQNSTVTFDVKGLAAGMYMVQIQGTNSTLTQRVVVK